MSEMVWMLIENEGAVLLAQRKEDRPPFAGEWALPGEVSAEGESASDTLVRIAADDFGVDLEGNELLETLTVSSGGVDHEIGVYRVGFEGSPKFRESGPYAEVGWAEPKELEDLDIELPQTLRDFLVRLTGGA